VRLSLLILASTYFSVRDILSHRIRNLDLLIFTGIALCISWFSSSDVYPVSFAVVSLVSSYADLLLGLCIGSAATLAIGLVRRKSFDFAMPFAPAICFGVIYCASLS
jgi:hypothetical protein